MASRKIEDLHPALQKAWTESYKEWIEKYPTASVPFLTCTHRDNEEQEILYMMDKNGKDDDGDGKIDESDEWRSNAKPGQSKHNSFPAEAFDIAFKDRNGKLDWNVDLFKMFAGIVSKYGVRWGGTWRRKDNPHYEL
jgi:hypothetical protein